MGARIAVAASKPTVRPGNTKGTTVVSGGARALPQTTPRRELKRPMRPRMLTAYAAVVEIHRPTPVPYRGARRQQGVFEMATEVAGVPICSAGQSAPRHGKCAEAGKSHSVTSRSPISLLFRPARYYSSDICCLHGCSSSRSELVASCARFHFQCMGKSRPNQYRTGTALCAGEPTRDEKRLRGAETARGVLPIRSTTAGGAFGGGRGWTWSEPG